MQAFFITTAPASAEAQAEARVVYDVPRLQSAFLLQP